MRLRDVIGSVEDMGWWGRGNFDGDDPCDVRDSFVRETAKRIERELFAANTDMYLADGEIMPWIAMLLAICDQCGGHPPRPQVVGRWQTRYLELFEAAQAVDDYDEERRNVIDSTFARLLALSRHIHRCDDDEAIPPAGAAYLVPLEDGRFGVCRVLSRVWEDDDELYGAPMSLVANTEWIGSAAPPLDDPAVRRILQINRPGNPQHLARPAMGWLSEPPPSTFRYLGVVPPSEDEAEMAPAVFLRDWDVIAEERLLWAWRDEEGRKR